MAIADPKDYAQPKEPTMANALTLMAGILEELKASKNTDQAEKQIALMESLIVKTIPENKEHPGISVYSHPEGEKKRPKDPLRCKTYWCGRDINGDTETPEEIELLNRLEPGEFRVTKADGSSIPFTVGVKKTEAGKLESVHVWFPCKNEHRHNHMSMSAYMRQVLGDRIPSVTELQAELTRLKQELERAKTGVMSAV